jgi:hypothetical protein
MRTNEWRRPQVTLQVALKRRRLTTWYSCATAWMLGTEEGATEGVVLKLHRATIVTEPSQDWN